MYSLEYPKSRHVLLCDQQVTKFNESAVAGIKPFSSSTSAVFIEVMNGDTKFCLTAVAGQPKISPRPQPCAGSDLQKYRVDSEGRIRQASLCLTVIKGSVYTGAAVIPDACSSSTALYQTWIPDAEGRLRAGHFPHGLCLHLPPGSEQLTVASCGLPDITKWSAGRWEGQRHSCSGAWVHLQFVENDVAQIVRVTQCVSLTHLALRTEDVYHRAWARL